MRFSETSIPGALKIQIERHADDRGFFARTYCIEEFSEAGIDLPMIQDSIAFNHKAGTLRGLHYHAPGFPQTRLFRCIGGAAFAALVDLRPDSPTYLTNESHTLSESNHTALYVPPGIALGYQTLEDQTTVYYQMSELYDPALERGVRWNDPAFGVDWPAANRTMNDRDAAYPDFDPDRHVREHG